MLLAALGVLAACALPRGAPVLTEVAKGSQQAADAENISVVPITRESAKQIKSWPRPDGAGIILGWRVKTALRRISCVSGIRLT